MIYRLPKMVSVVALAMVIFSFTAGCEDEECSEVGMKKCDGDIVMECVPGADDYGEAILPWCQPVWEEYEDCVEDSMICEDIKKNNYSARCAAPTS